MITKKAKRTPDYTIRNIRFLTVITVTIFAGMLFSISACDEYRNTHAKVCYIDSLDYNITGHMTYGGAVIQYDTVYKKKCVSME